MLFMSRYLGPRFKIIRRLKTLPGLTSKRPKYKKRVHRSSRPWWKKSQYLVCLQEKQKIRFHYGLTERQLRQYVHIAKNAQGSTGQVLLQLLEMRLDNILFRLGIARTIPGARQLVNHRHILVNHHIVDIPSYRCKPQDIITLKGKDPERLRIRMKKSWGQLWKNRNRVPHYLTFNLSQNKGIVNKIIDTKDLQLKIKEMLVIEYYSRRI
uniref:Small ribosomal subunit protein uS4c n=122 Tax=Ephedra TaxID=3387 RepID=A0A8F4YMW4_9SPER|nr:ribosomal protein S4 [Ephedra equisetina]YP_009231415.1 ribosomal protein S4 [Ephedra foeminea]YP_009694706.1 ribosomal protein S4 [Ephedra intermedia]YP_009694779.1 ribosomal protein S4 [Ephedra sinica]YP_010048913.1 ribosomal protein S4 [Ephedra monosperma]YP_010207326.1 ribosomal protein S4 [Ephedra przewalskii]YP_010451834.1 ribosomal protein S4 [Ephedra alata]YP_010451901.1 ribosomal protein S4 [Ephedra altissima]YP_010451968.1 ribosomal protein S4 [Ephedra americana]YP_010452035.1